ncbi:MAG TPA: PQQ-dependent sugar dehydrogenase [Thermoanaerobaculia bacterium]|jgi:glucose/arabinose dehydrogenase|nr:PQQ-dependent sugar dehydrogenase [Thermoanaerobaculia bacterium]
MSRHLRRFLGPALLLLISLPRSSAPQADPEPAKGPFTVSGSVQGLSLQQIAENLGSLTGITNAGDGRLFLTLRDGRIVIFENGGVRSQPFLDIRGQTTTDSERGLLSAAFHPRYAENGFFFINYTNLSGDTVIARYQVAAGDPNRADVASARTLLTISQPFSNHNGGQVQFGPDGFLYIGMGDGGSAFDPDCRAQKTSTLLGKMLRIDVDQNVATPPFYGIPASNPFRGAGDPLDEIWASGFRNPWRFSFDRETGDLWIGDVGQNHREEIDFQPAASHGGENYGWKVMEGTACSSTDACPASTPACDSTAFTPPALEYDHDPPCSVTGGYVYRGSRLAQLRGAYVFTDYCTGVVWAAFRQGAGFTVRTISGGASTITTFGEDAAGELYAATLTGKLFRIAGSSTGGRAETVGLYDPQTSKFQLKAANSATAGVRVLRFGPRRSGWIPIAGDWDGDGTTTVGFYDPGLALFRLKNATPGGGADVILHVDPPSAGVVPVVGDWDGDGKDTVGLYDGTTGIFHLKNSLAGSGFDLTVDFGPPGEVRTPLAGDWDGNGADGIGLFDPRESVFTLANSFAGGGPDLQFQFGPRGRGSLPVAGDWDGDGRDTVGVYDPSSAVFRLKNGLSGGNPDLTFRFGPRRSGWKPVAGAW